jgi:hypothetical protein
VARRIAFKDGIALADIVPQKCAESTVESRILIARRKTTHKPIKAGHSDFQLILTN